MPVRKGLKPCKGCRTVQHHRATRGSSAAWLSFVDLSVNSVATLCNFLECQVVGSEPISIRACPSTGMLGRPFRDVVQVREESELYISEKVCATPASALGAMLVHFHPPVHQSSFTAPHAPTCRYFPSSPPHHHPLPPSYSSPHPPLVLSRQRGRLLLPATSTASSSNTTSFSRRRAPGLRSPARTARRASSEGAAASSSSATMLLSRTRTKGTP